MNKTELQIANENVNAFFLAEDRQKHIWVKPCEDHKQSCERFLKVFYPIKMDNDCSSCKDNGKYYSKLFYDLENAIKLYKENDI